jgi:hypothetical protein
MIARLLLLGGVILLAGFTEPAPQPKPLDPAEAARQGRELVAEILAQHPTQNFTSTGVLKIRSADGNKTNVPVQCNIYANVTDWRVDYVAVKKPLELALTTGSGAVQIVHSNGCPNYYLHYVDDIPVSLSGYQTMTPFLRSDFWIADLGLEFFHWPDQKLLKSELRKTRLSRVLESINPHPSPNGYSRIVSWIDDESRGILHAEAYDSQNKLLKEFDTKKFKKVNGEWQLEQMEIYNVQTRSRTQIEFNFDAK